MAFSTRGHLLVPLLFLAVWASHATSRTLSEESMADRHKKWMAQHHRVYKDAHEKERGFKIFKENMERIEAFNAGNHKYKLGPNRFADLTQGEFKAMYTGYRPLPQGSIRTTSKRFRYENVTEVPPSIDWRDKGAVTPVKDQGQCGCCWAFSSVAAVEGITQISTGQLTSLSEQELVDCDTQGNNGCNGGTMTEAFQFIVDNSGLAGENSYPYQGFQGACDTEKAASSVAKIAGHENVPQGSEEALLNAVANQPVSVAVDASGFQLYSGGIYNGGGCGTNLDHAVTVVGYGADGDGTKYWMVKNSWGSSWGENGYIRLERDVGAEGGLCGIALQASYPTA